MFLPPSVPPWPRDGARCRRGSVRRGSCRLVCGRAARQERISLGIWAVLTASTAPCSGTCRDVTHPTGVAAASTSLPPFSTQPEVSLHPFSHPSRPGVCRVS